MLRKILNNYLSNNQQPNGLTFWLFGAFYVVVLVICIANGKMGNDEGTWTYMARVWLENDMLPYQEAVDHKPSGIFLLYGVSHVLFGINFWFPRLMAGICIGLTGFCLYRINSDHFSQKAGLISMILYCLTIFWDVFNGALIAQSETFMVLFSSIALYATFKGLKPHQSTIKFNLFAGISLGVAIAFKQVAGLSLLAVLIILWFHQGFTRRYLFGTLALVFAAFFSFVLFHLPLVNISNFNDYIYWVWLNPNTYPSIFWRIPNFLEKFLDSKLMIFYPILFLGWVFRKTIGINIYTRGLTVWGILAFIGVNISGYYFGHHFTQLLPPLTLLSGIVMAFGLQKMQSHGFYFYKMLLVILIVFAPWPVLFHNSASIAFSQKNLLNSFINHFQDHSKMKDLANWLQQNTEDEHIYYFGRRTNSILSLSEKLSPSKFFNTSFVNNTAIQKQVVTNLKAKKPKIIIKDKDMEGLSIIGDYVQKHYQLDHKRRYWTILKRE